jgi:uncharacterized protein YggU (UPF0235/DUF167 family)
VELGPEGLIKVYVTAAPTDGEANEAVIKVLGRKLGLAKSKVTIVRGYTSREKRVHVDGLDLEGAMAKLSPR